MSQKIRIKLKSYDHNLVDKSAEKIVKTVKGSDTAAYPEADFYGKPFDVRQQEGTRAVPALHLQADIGHLQLHAQNHRRAHETGAAVGCRGRD